MWGLRLCPPVSLRRNVSLLVSRSRISDGLPFGGASTTSLTRDRYRLPLELRLGVGYQVDDRWAMGLDVQRRSFASSSTYKSIWRLATGVTYVPQRRALSYFKRLPYRFGLSWEQLPYRISNHSLQDLSAYLGSALLLRRGAQIDFGMRFGLRGKSTQETLEERYIQVYIGSTLVSRWFVRQKYD